MMKIPNISEFKKYLLLLKLNTYLVIICNPVLSLLGTNYIKLSLCTKQQLASAVSMRNFSYCKFYRRTLSIEKKFQSSISNMFLISLFTSINFSLLSCLCIYMYTMSSF